MLVAFQDEASRFGAALPDALIRLGATEPIILEYRSSFALAGYAGSFMPSWVSQAQAKQAEGPSILTTTITLGNLSCFLLFFVFLFLYSFFFSLFMAV